MHKLLTPLYLFLGLFLSLACGTNSSPSTGTPTTATQTETIIVTGELDFPKGSNKPRYATSVEKGDVKLTNISSGNSVTASVIGTTFSANVEAGDYIITARSASGNYLRKLFPSVTAENKTAGKVDFDSTSILEIIEQRIKDDNAISSLSSLVASKTIQSVLTETKTSYTENPNDFTDFKNELKISLARGDDISAESFTFSANTLEGLKYSDLFQSSIQNLFTKEVAVVNTVASDYSAGSYSVVSTADFTSTSTIKPYASDITINTFGKKIFVLGKFNIDTLDSFNIEAPSINLYPGAYPTLLSTETKSANPYAVISQGAFKAYIPRYGSDLVLIVNPSAKSKSDFHKSSIDLSVYDEGDGAAEISGGIIIGSKLFLIAQRLKFYSPTETSYLIVIDTNTETEILTGKGEGSLKGIALPAKNPNQITYSKSTGLIYIQCIGAYSPQACTGGIVSVDPKTYETKLLIDDGDDASSTGLYGGLITNMALTSSTKGYLTISKSFGNNATRSFDLTSGNVSAEIAPISTKDIRGISIDSKERLWVSAAKGLIVLDSKDDSIVKESIDVGLLPNGPVQFIRY